MANEAGTAVPKEPSGDMKYLADHVGGVHCGENQMNSSANNVRSQGDTALIHEFICTVLLVTANCREQQTLQRKGKGSKFHSCLPISSYRATFVIMGIFWRGKYRGHRPGRTNIKRPKEKIRIISFSFYKDRPAHQPLAFHSLLK